MQDLIKIAIDAMGGDGSPKKIIDGIVLNHKTNGNNFFKIFGDEKKISKLINNKIEKKFSSLNFNEMLIPSIIFFGEFSPPIASIAILTCLVILIKIIF